MSDFCVLEFHREIVGFESVSHQEKALADFLVSRLSSFGLEVKRHEDNIFVTAGSGPRLLFNSHFDTVPPGTAWTRDPFEVQVVEGRVFGLGSNDAKASVAAMVGALLTVAEQGGPCELGLLLVPQEETGGRGAEIAWPALRDGRFGGNTKFDPQAVVVGEPTNLDLAVAQKGLLIAELLTHGDGGHSANAAAQGAQNAIRELARDLVALESLDLDSAHPGAVHPLLGATTLEPTLVEGGEARNKVAESAKCLLDLRTVPGREPADWIADLRECVSGDVRVVSDRLRSIDCDPQSWIVRAALRARPEAKTYGSRTLSDWVYFREIPGIKCGPGRTERSHQPDEFVMESEILAGRGFYERLCENFAGERTLAAR